MQPFDPEEPARGRLRRFLNRLEIDRATFYAVAARAWQLLTGPVTMLLIAGYFSPEVQGYFYTFASLMAVQALVELRLHGVLVTVASHEWTHLELDDSGRPTGDRESLSRLQSLARTAVLWYSVVSALFLVGVGIGGVIFLRRQPDVGVDWLAPWIGLVAPTGLTIWLLPLVAILEGCNQVSTVNRFRTIQAVCGTATVWVCVAAGAGLWTAGASAAVRLLIEFGLVGWTFRRFTQTLLFTTRRGGMIPWADIVWPLQWRVGVQAVIGYFAANLFVPLMMEYRDAVVAGRMGMTLTALTAIEYAALAWVQTRAPLFGMLAARRDFRELDRVYFRLLDVSTRVVVAGAALVAAGVWVLNQINHPLAQNLADRVLSPEATLVFAAAIAVFHIPKCMGIYVLAHRRDPFLVPGVISSAAIALAAWQLGMRYGPLGVGVGYLAVIVLFYVPCWWAIWTNCRTRWHGDDARDSPESGDGEQPPA